MKERDGGVLLEIVLILSHELSVNRINVLLISFCSFVPFSVVKHVYLDRLIRQLVVGNNQTVSNFLD